MDNERFKSACYQKDRGNRNKEIIREPLKNLEDANLSVKLDMAEELQKMGLTATAISRLLNIKDDRR
jgi:hypothetical protein